MLKHAYDEDPKSFQREVLTLTGNKHDWFARDRSRYGADASVYLPWYGYYAEYGYSQHNANAVHKRLLRDLEPMRIPHRHFEVWVAGATGGEMGFVQEERPAPPIIPGVIYPTNVSWDTWAGKAIAHLCEQVITHMQEEQTLHMRIRALEEQLRRRERRR